METVSTAQTTGSVPSGAGTSSVTLVICTRNRADSLRATLQCIGECEVSPSLEAELLVVDNASTDDTAHVVRAARLTNLPVRYLLAPEPGLSNARNAALRATGADMVLFTDDDVRVPRDWIAGMCRPMLAGKADAVAGGVRFPAHYEPLLAREPFRSKRGWFASNEGWDPAHPTAMVGANMAFNRRVIDALGGFDPQLGAGALGFYEEAVFSWRLKELGLRLVGAADVWVEHHFDFARLTRRTILAMAERMGKSEAYINYHWHHQAARAEPLKAWRARLLLWVERVRRPWSFYTRYVPLEEIQRVQTLAFWEQYGRLAGTPRNYPAPAPSVLR
jgi:glycosyltransferase involved in cell wall biosynthesis